MMYGGCRTVFSVSMSRPDDMLDSWFSNYVLNKFSVPTSHISHAQKSASLMQTFLNPSIWTSIRGLSGNPLFVAGTYRTGVGFRNAALALQGES